MGSGAHHEITAKLRNNEITTLVLNAPTKAQIQQIITQLRNNTSVISLKIEKPSSNSGYENPNLFYHDLTQLLKTPAQIATLDLSGINLGSKTIMSRVWHAIKTHQPQLKTLMLKNCNLTNSDVSVMMVNIANSMLTQIDLSGNGELRQETIQAANQLIEINKNKIPSSDNTEPGEVTIETQREQVLQSYLNVQEPQGVSTVTFEQVFQVPLDSFYKSMYRNVANAEDKKETKIILTKIFHSKFLSRVTKINGNKLGSQDREALFNLLKKDGYIDQDNSVIRSYGTKEDFENGIKEKYSKDYNIEEIIAALLRYMPEIPPELSTVVDTLDARPKRWYFEYHGLTEKINGIKADITNLKTFITAIINSFKNPSTLSYEQYKLHQENLNKFRKNELELIKTLQNLEAEKALLVREMRRSGYRIEELDSSISMNSGTSHFFQFDIQKASPTKTYTPISFPHNMILGSSEDGNNNWKSVLDELSAALQSQNILTSRLKYLFDSESTEEVLETPSEQDTQNINHLRSEIENTSVGLLEVRDELLEKQQSLTKWQVDLKTLKSFSPRSPYGSDHAYFFHINFMPFLKEKGTETQISQSSEFAQYFNKYLSEILSKNGHTFSSNEVKAIKLNSVTFYYFHKDITSGLIEYNSWGTDRDGTRYDDQGRSIESATRYVAVAIPETTSEQTQKDMTVAICQRTTTYFLDDSTKRYPILLSKVTQSNGDTKSILEMIPAAIEICRKQLEECQVAIETLSNKINTLSQQKAEQQKQINLAPDKIIEKNRLRFLIKWNDPELYNHFIFKTVKPNQDPLVEYLDKLDEDKDETQKTDWKIYQFDPTPKGFYNQFGQSLSTFMDLYKERNKLQDLANSNAQTVLLLPAYDQNNTLSPEIIRAVRNPKPAIPEYQTDLMPTVQFVESYALKIEYRGFAIGELSHSVNLMPGERKELVIERRTKIAKKLSQTQSDKSQTAQKTSSSFEENLESEFSTSDKTQTKQEDKQRKSSDNSQKSTNEEGGQSSSTDYWEVGLNAKASWGWGGIDANAKMTSNSTQGSNWKSSREQALKLTQNQESMAMTNQSRDTLSKNIGKALSKVANETSHNNTVEISTVSNEEFESTSSYKETVEISNENNGKTANFHFFQLKNVYTTSLYLSDVKIVVNTGIEQVKGTGITDVRVFELEEFGKMLVNLPDSPYSVLLSAIVAKQVLSHYANFLPNLTSGNGALSLANDYPVDKKIFQTLKFAGEIEPNVYFRDIDEQEKCYAYPLSSNFSQLYTNLPTTAKELSDELKNVKVDSIITEVTYALETQSLSDETLKQYQAEWVELRNKVSKLTSLKNSPTLSTNVDGDNKREKFKRQIIIGDGDCGYTAFGIKRSEAYKLLLDNIHNEIVAQLLEPAIRGALIIEKFQQYATGSGNNPKLKIAISAKEDLLKFPIDTDIIKAYLNYNIREKRDNGWVHLATLQALAHLKKCNLIVWKLSEERDLLPYSDKVHNNRFQKYEFSTEQDAKEIHLLFVHYNHLDRLESTASIKAKIENLNGKITTFKSKPELKSSYLNAIANGIINPGYLCLEAWCKLSKKITLNLWTSDESKKLFSLHSVSADIGSKDKLDLLVNVGHYFELAMLQNIDTNTNVNSASLVSSSGLINQLKTALRQLQKIPFAFKPVRLIDKSTKTINAGAFHLDSELGYNQAIEPYVVGRREIERDRQKALVQQIRKGNIPVNIPDGVTQLTLQHGIFQSKLPQELSYNQTEQNASLLSSGRS